MRAARQPGARDAGLAVQAEEGGELRERQLNPLFSQRFVESLAQRVLQRLQQEPNDVLGVAELQPVAEASGFLGIAPSCSVIR